MQTIPFPAGYQDLGGDTHLVDINLYRPGLAACYIVRHNDEIAIIDCGTPHSAPSVLQTLQAIDARPEQVRWVVPTHVHLDHASGAGQLMDACQNATLAVHPKGYPHMVDPGKLQAGAMAVYGEQAFMRDFGSLQPIADERSLSVADGEALPLGGRVLTFVHTPGHANHHGCIHDDHTGYLFTGDTFGLGYQEFATEAPYLVATTTPVAFDPDAWMISLDRMLDTDPSAVCLTHFSKHADPASLAPMLRTSIQAHAEIALNEERDPTEGRLQRLQQAVAELLVSGAVAHCGMSETRVRELLDGDIHLNAQGLEVWLKRRAKRHES